MLGFRALLLPLILVGVPAACGGRTVREGGGDGAGTGGASGGAGGSQQGGRGGLGWGTTPLDPCVPGPSYQAGKPCPWLADERCYDTRDAACACVCPSDRDSVCVESWSDVGKGSVDCY